MSQTDLFNVEALPPGWRLVALPEVDSTSEELRRRAAEAPGEGLVVTAAIQTQGRGRRGRSWTSPTGNLYVSLRLAQAASLAETAQLSFVAAVALGDALAEAAPHLSVRFKWPNDLLVNGGKISGILLETEGPWILLGIGVNLTFAPPADGAAFPPTNLAAEGAQVTRQDLLPALCRHLAELLHLWRTQGFEVVRRLWLERARGLGEPVVARLQSGEEITGTFADLDADGALVMDVPGAGRRRIMAGDVFFPVDPPSPAREA